MKVLLACIALAPLAACDDHDDGHGHAKTHEIRFAAKVGAEDFACDKTFTNVGTSAATVLEPLDFRLYVHQVELLDAEGNAYPLVLEQDELWQSQTLALLDFEDRSGTCSNGTVETNAVVRGTIDTGHEEVDYVGLRFRVGVPFAMNHGDASTAASPLNLSGLFWSWQAGYKFMRLDMKVQGADGGGGGHGAGGINLHLGSTGCELGEGTTEVQSCAAANRAHVELADFDPANDTVVIDYGALVAGVDLAMDMGGAPGCMSGKDDPECATIFDHLGIALESGEPKAGQTAFRVE